MDRRTFLRGLAAVAGSAAIGAAAGDPGAGAAGAVDDKRHKPKPKGTKRKSSTAGTHEVDGLPVADWVVEENKLPGEPPEKWAIQPGPTPAGYPAPIEGFVDQVSYTHGDQMTVYVNTVAPHYRIDVFRIGYYQGNGARRIRSTTELTGKVQPAPQPQGDVHLIECSNWTPSAYLEVAEDWTPGMYLLHLVGGGGQRHYVPFLVRDDKSKAAFAVQSCVTTWQAYNLYGGYSLYGGPPSGALADRAYVVSFDRPYRNPDSQGSGDFMGNELPFVYLAERHGLDVTYWTDVDLHARPQLLANHKALISLGHDEYWSWQMRFDGVMDALAKGVNVAFLGANACYRQIRLQPSAKGVADRQVVCYKDAQADPVTKTHPKLATGPEWANDPVPYPESEMIGQMYQSYGAAAPLVVADASSFIFEGTGLKNGDKIEGLPNQGVVGNEFDGFEPRLPGPRNVQIVAHSPVDSVSGALHSDMTYYSHSGGGAVFATGTGRWVQELWDGAPALDDALNFGHSPAQPTAATMTLNVLRAFGKGPAGKKHPSTANWRKFYSPNAAVVQSVDVSGT